MSKRTSKNNASKIIKSSNDEHFIENLYVDEIRNGFLVTSHRKKVWNAQIGLINEFARICKKHNLRWFADGGTLLGVIRHGGFIPWDDDIDAAMLRPDYEKFKQVAPQEISYPYFFDNWYEYHLECEEPLPLKLNPNYQYITNEELKKRDSMRWISQYPSIRLRDSRTTMIEFVERKHIHQGIFLDISALDSTPTCEDPKRFKKFVAACELDIASHSPNRMKMMLENDTEFMLDRSVLQKFLKLPYRERGRLSEETFMKIFYDSKYVDLIHHYTVINKPRKLLSDDYSDVIYMPFEKIELPVPVGYEDILKEYYGDWRKMKIDHIHSNFYSADIPYLDVYDSMQFA